MKKFILFGILLFFLGTSLIPSTGSIVGDCNSEIDNKTKVTSNEMSTVNEETEYWALLIAVGIYADHPDEDWPEMLEGVENLHNELLVSTFWKENHIKVIKGENANMFNIYRGFGWLKKMSDEDDFSLVYITTHGGQIRDRWPWDESDRLDEILATYHGFQYPWVNIRDDDLNSMLSSISAKGICVVIDSCHAGGFNDTPYLSSLKRRNNVNATEWMQEFANEIQGQGRVILMGCREDELSYCDVFTPLLIRALRGYSDTNGDGLCSAEEAFDYIAENINPSFKMHPTIYDGYNGELQLTEVEFPPSFPEKPSGQIIGNINTTYVYSTVSVDPDGDNIKYGWDWNSDYIVDEWSDYFGSGVRTNISHTWSIEGTYNIHVKAVDERGVESIWSSTTVVSMSSDNIPDQNQTVIGSGIYLGDQWIAQSFVPTLNSLSKVELEIISWSEGNPPLIHLYIRDSLNGVNLANSSLSVPPMEWGIPPWSIFDFEDIEIIPGNTYYIIVEKVENCEYTWLGTIPDTYPSGEYFISGDGISWESYYGDGCFVTWGKI